jgi:hypothetical protein
MSIRPFITALLAVALVTSLTVTPAARGRAPLETDATGASSA